VFVAAHAVADPTRLALLRHIQVADRRVSVRELATEFGLHENAVRKHLVQLRSAGLVIEEVQRQGAVGRPRLTYRPDPDSAGVLAGWNPYEVLSLLLVEVASGRAAREVGADYGRRLGEAAAPERTPIELLEAVTRRHGFQPTTETHGDDTQLVLGRCPFAASVTADRLVCDLHLGIAEGIAASVRTVNVTGLDVAPPREGGCRFHLRLAPTEGESHERPIATS
jgi:predicted ArsR family transcriptional regulator